MYRYFTLFLTVTSATLDLEESDLSKIGALDEADQF